MRHTTQPSHSTPTTHSLTNDRDRLTRTNTKCRSSVYGMRLAVRSAVNLGASSLMHGRPIYYAEANLFLCSLRTVTVFGRPKPHLAWRLFITSEWSREGFLRRDCATLERRRGEQRAPKARSLYGDRATTSITVASARRQHHRHRQRTPAYGGLV